MFTQKNGVLKIKKTVFPSHFRKVLCTDDKVAETILIRSDTLRCLKSLYNACQASSWRCWKRCCLKCTLRKAYL